MIISLSKSKSVRKKDITGIFDLDTSTVSAVTRNFLRDMEKRGEIINIKELPKSFILTGKKEVKVYFSSKTVKSFIKNK